MQRHGLRTLLVRRRLQNATFDNPRQCLHRAFDKAHIATTTRKTSPCAGTKRSSPLLRAYNRLLGIRMVQVISQLGPLRMLYRVSCAFLIYHITTRYFYSFRSTYGISMLPTLNSSGDWVLISKYYRRGRDIQVGDLVSYSHPGEESVQAVKRVVGLEGDFVAMGPGFVDDDGKTITGFQGGKMIQVPRGHCWVVGDNLKHSRDSRLFGPLPLALVRGKIVARVAGYFDMQWIRNGLQDGEHGNDLD